MGIVYRARQLSLNRDVAIKILKPNLVSNSTLLARFRNEAETAGRLADSHILPVFDVLDVGGAPVLVLPYIEGSDLRKVIRDRFGLRNDRSIPAPHAWAALDDRKYLGRVLPLLDQLIDAVAAMHSANVLHRDIKPSNVLVDPRGNAWLSDFGLARLGENAMFTGRGPIGTHGYMSPEQSAGGMEVDSRSDLFALGVTMYQALTLELPYGMSGAKPSDALPAAPSRRQPLISRDLDAVVLKAIEPSVHDRYTSAAELQEDWRAARQGLLPKARRLGPLGRLARRVRRNAGAVVAAALFMVVVSLVAYLARSSPAQVIVDPTRAVRITTEPPGARVALVPIDDEPYDYTDGEPLPSLAIRASSERTTPLTFSSVPPGTYLVVAELPDHRFHEVYRTVPARGANPAGSFPHQTSSETEDGTVDLPLIRIPEDRPDAPVESGMYRFKEGTFTMGAETPRPVMQIAPPHERMMPAYYLETLEVTVGQYRAVMKHLPGQYGPFKTPTPDNHAVSYVSYDEALAYAEAVGKRLPTESEFEFAATLKGTQQFPWGNDASRITGWAVGPVGEPDWDRTPTDPPIFGLYSNVAEWTSSMLGPYPSVTNVPEMPEKLRANWRTGRVVRGGPWPVVVVVDAPEEWEFGPRWRHAVSRTDHYRGLGFRCARSDRPRFLPTGQ
jgi:formylglycine-generating enzyme required for sulfatase activity